MQRFTVGYNVENKRLLSIHTPTHTHQGSRNIIKEEVKNSKNRDWGGLLQNNFSGQHIAISLFGLCLSSYSCLHKIKKSEFSHGKDI